MEKPLEATWKDQQVGSGRASRTHQGGATCVSQVDRDSYMVTTCFCTLGRGGLDKGIMISASTSI